MKTLVLLSFGILCTPAFAEPADPSKDQPSVEKIGDGDLGLETRRSYREERRLRFYRALEAEKADLLSCWVTFIEEGGLDTGSITWEDVQRADKPKKIRLVTEKNGDLAATLELGTQSRMLSKDRPEVDDLFSSGQVARMRRHSWVLTMRFDAKSHALTAWDLKFSYVEDPKEDPEQGK